MKATQALRELVLDAAVESGGYDEAVRAGADACLSGEELFFELAIEDLRRAADEFLPIHERTEREGAKQFVTAWNDLMTRVSVQSASLA